MDLSHFDLQTFIISLVVVVCSISLHEFGHAISADYLGDPGPRRAGRITLWPDKHFDPVGFTMIVATSLFGVGMGWGLPVMVNSRCFKNPNRDMMIVTICGPLMNLILALVFGLLLRFTVQAGVVTEHSLWYAFFMRFLLVNLALMYFNMIPISPLDGSKILYGLLPFSMATRYERFMGQYGYMLLLILVFTGGTWIIIGPAVNEFMRLILGPGWGTG